MTTLTDAERAQRENLLARIHEVIRIESRAVASLIGQVGESALDAVELIVGLRGRLVVTGMGKSGHIARKVAATFASTGTPAFFVHPAEAKHGDLGMIQPEDIVLAFSYSGETDELREIAPHIKRLGTPLIAITGRTLSSLAQLANIHLCASVSEEACPFNLAPTASTAAALALGDALAMGVLERRGFGADDFARSHPGGSLGRRLLVRVEDVMRKGSNVPRSASNETLQSALTEMGEKRMGMTAIVDEAGCPLGIFTDGDLRRLLAQGKLTPDLTMESVMTRGAQFIEADSLASEAANRMERQRINHLLIVNDHGVLIGAIGMHDLLEAKIV